MKRKTAERIDPFEDCKEKATRHLSKFKGKALVEELRRVVREAEKDAGGPFLRANGRPARVGRGR